MALADYFDRASEGAAQILHNYDRAEFERRLNDRDVVIAYDDNALATSEGRATLDMLIRLVARMYPKLELRPLRGAKRAIDLEDLARAVNPRIEIVDARKGKAATVVVGETPSPSGHSIYIGSDFWVASVGTTAPIGSVDSGNPFGAGAAACLGAANLFRVFFGDLLENGELDKEARISLLNFATGDKAANDFSRRSIDIGLVQIVGIGAIGNAIVWALSQGQHLAGMVDLIDPQSVELSNLQRYVLTERTNETAIKVNLAASALPGLGKVTANPVQKSWSEFVRHSGNHHFDLVATALDTAADRVEVQGTLPKFIVNAWTQPGDIGVSRHGFLGDNACLACMYLPTGKRGNQDELVAEELRMSDLVREIRAMLHTGQPVGPDFVREVARRATVDAEALMPFANLPLREFRAKAICGQALLAAPDSDRTAVQVPMAFQSAMAGVMLAAEIVAQRGELRDAALPTKSALDLLRPVPGRLNVPVIKDNARSARCICLDEDYAQVFRSKYELPEKAKPTES